MEYSAEHIFSNALTHWHIDTPIKNCIETFWHGLKLSAKIYPDTIEVLKELKEKGYIIATLTDLPNAMPDEIYYYMKVLDKDLSLCKKKTDDDELALDEI